MRKLSSSGLGRETGTTTVFLFEQVQRYAFDRAYHRVAWEPRENRGLLLWGVPANYTEEAVSGPRPEDGWLVWEPREHRG